MKSVGNWSLEGSNIFSGLSLEGFCVFLYSILRMDSLLLLGRNSTKAGEDEIIGEC